MNNDYIQRTLDELSVCDCGRDCFNVQWWKGFAPSRDTPCRDRYEDYYRVSRDSGMPREIEVITLDDDEDDVVPAENAERQEAVQYEVITISDEE